MDTSRLLTVLGMAAVAFGIIFTLFSLYHVVRSTNAVDEVLSSAMTNAMRQVLREETNYQIAAQRIDEIERSHVVVARGTSYCHLRRLAARIAFVAANDKGASFEDVSARYQRACELGFHSIRSELATLIEFAFACLHYGHYDEGLHALARARERLSAVSSGLQRLQPGEDGIVAGHIDGPPAMTVGSQRMQLSVLIERCGELLESSVGRTTEAV